MKYKHKHCAGHGSRVSSRYRSMDKSRTGHWGNYSSRDGDWYWSWAGSKKRLISEAKDEV